MTVIDKKEKIKALKGARFLQPSEPLVGNELSREPKEYKPTSSFRNRIRELGGIVDGDMINDAIMYGTSTCASEGCNAFVLFKPGVTFSFIWRPAASVHHTANMISVWPYVYDREKALDSGYWSSREINTMEEIAAKNSENNEHNS